MSNLQAHIDNYLDYCQNRKGLNVKTLQAYRADLEQFARQFPDADISALPLASLESYVSELQRRYKSKTVRRKIASLKTFFHFLEYRGALSENPFTKLQFSLREPFILPKIIPLHTITALRSAINEQRICAKTAFQRKNALRDAAIIELLFTSGIKISELCSLSADDVDLDGKSILIPGRGCQRRRISLSDSTVHILAEYKREYQNEIHSCRCFFANQSGRKTTDQSVRRMIRKYASMASISLHITPRMFRHTFATDMLAADTDIRHVQETLGHSSVSTTAIYFQVALARQRELLTTEQPKKDSRISGGFRHRNT